MTGTDNDDNGGDASKIAVSYAMGALTLSASVEDESKADGSEDDTTVGVKYAMNDALTLSYTTIKPGSNGSFGDEWDAKVAYSAGGVSASFALDEADATTVILSIHSVVVLLHSQQCTTKLVQLRLDSYWLDLRILSETDLVKERAALRRRSFFETTALVKKHLKTKRSTTPHVNFRCEV